MMKLVNDGSDQIVSFDSAFLGLPITPRCTEKTQRLTEKEERTDFDQVVY